MALDSGKRFELALDTILSKAVLTRESASSLL